MGRRLSFVLPWLLMTSCLIRAQEPDEQTMALGVDSIHSRNDICLMLGGRAIAGDFFKGLQSHRTHRGRSFKRNGKPVKLFPEQLTVKVDAGLIRCAGKK